MPLPFFHLSLLNCYFRLVSVLMCFYIINDGALLSLNDPANDNVIQSIT